MKNEEGFSLIEVIASLVILTIILMFFASIFVQNNKTAVRNSDKLVVTQIADAYLERLKVEGFPKGTGTQTDYDNFCQPNNNNKNSTFRLNDFNYPVEVKLKNVFNGMCSTVVTVTGKNGKISGVVEGYVHFK